MDVSHLLDSLNDAQREAVTAPAQPMLVLAGAGSGKTRVLVHRIAWLIQVESISPYGVLAVTFTNKAAAEMRGRTEELLGVPTGGMWVGTFHSLAHRLLRAHWKEAELQQSFQILDSDDQHRLIKRVIRGMELDETQWSPRQLQWYINSNKDEGFRPRHIEVGDDPHQQKMVQIYQAYEDACMRGGLVDFAELLLRAHELWTKRPDVLAAYQQRFQHILVDEFQDTNAIQYAWLRILAGTSSNLFVVGDDDQSIYGWRGARIENIQKFSTDFPATNTIRLEQNYRSSGNLLAAANALIANNNDRLGKNLWTDSGDGEPILLYRAFNEIDEARFIAETIQDREQHGYKRSEIAVLYRSNAQSRVLEEALIRAGIPYRVYGGLRFFERAEIRDAMAYLRLLASADDDAAFERVVNTPTRGIGERSMAQVRELARDGNISLSRAAQTAIKEQNLSNRALKAITVFMELLDQMRAAVSGLSLDETLAELIHQSGLINHFNKEKGERAQSRLENLEELVGAAREFEFDDQEGLDELSAFVSHAALEAGEAQADAWQDCVQLMTMHSAKGLEFPVIFLCGMEEGLFPHQMSLEEPGRLSEERRLCYVGITRAMQQLYITQAEKRRLWGSENYPLPSRFISEIPAELIQEIRLRGGAPEPIISTQPESTGKNGVNLGQRVAHAKFGEGVVLNIEGQGSNARVQVNFESAGSKWLVLGYAGLQKL